MAPSTYYANKARPPSARACRDEIIGPALRELWEDNYRVYGARKLWKAARRAGHDVGRDQVSPAHAPGCPWPVFSPQFWPPEVRTPRGDVQL